jgi:hypothetical protein
MSSVLTINGKEYVPAIVAGKHFGYTKDYLLLLIKQGYIDGQKIGNKWYVNIPSASQHFKTASAKREVRKKLISEERKRELRTHMRAQAKRKTSSSSVFRVAFVTSVVALVMGVTAYTGYVEVKTQQASVPQDTYRFFEDMARSLYAFLTPTEYAVVDGVTAKSSTSSVSSVATVEYEAVSAHIGTTTYTSIIVAPDELFTATTIESIQDSFSDPVNVSIDPHNPQTGIITPVFKKGAGDAYRFVMVPVTQQ